MKGVFLQGGGAKGAFQAGALYALYESGISFNVVTGTSIGAINGYFIKTGNVDKLKEIWLEDDMLGDRDKKVFSNVYENDDVIEKISQYKGTNNELDSMFVNYVKVEGSRVEEVIVDVAHKDEKETLEAIKYSSLLPIRMEKEQSIGEIIRSYDAKKAFEDFKEDLASGVYDGYYLDGGILNNNFLSPFIENRVDKLYLLPVRHDYRVPEGIKEAYKEEDIIVIRPDTVFGPYDTLNFDPEFRKRIFKEGYDKCKAIIH